jgi:hypothetical protein
VPLDSSTVERLLAAELEQFVTIRFGHEAWVVCPDGLLLEVVWSAC